MALRSPYLRLPGYHPGPSLVCVVDAYYLVKSTFGTIGANAYREPGLYVSCASGLRDVRLSLGSPLSFSCRLDHRRADHRPPVIAGDSYGR
jgi:hypothetical protein